MSFVCEISPAYLDAFVYFLCTSCFVAYNIARPLIIVKRRAEKIKFYLILAYFKYLALAALCSSKVLLKIVSPVSGRAKK